MKIGKEVEGRFKGIETLFISTKEAYRFFDTVEKAQAMFEFLAEHFSAKLLQVYISDHDNELAFNSPVLEALNEIGVLVTVEVTAMDATRRHYQSNVTFILSCIDTVEPSDYTESFMNLEPTDQVKFSKDLRVFCATKESFTVTKPEDFDDDLDISSYFKEEQA